MLLVLSHANYISDYVYIGDMFIPYITSLLETWCFSCYLPVVLYVRVMAYNYNYTYIHVHIYIVVCGSGWIWAIAALVPNPATSEGAD